MKWSSLVAGLVSSVALAQSPETLEAARLHKPEAQVLLQAELKACEASACPQAGRMALLAATLALSEGQAAEARRLLEAHPAPPLLEAFHAYYRGQALFYSGEPAQAAQAFALAVKKAPPSLAPRAKARLAEALLKAGKTAQAAPVLELAATQTPSAELLYQRALVRGAKGASEGARADLRAVALRYPTHPYADEALTQLELLNPPAWLTLDEHMRRARTLLDSGQASRALAELEKATVHRPAETPLERARLALARAQVLFALSRTEEAEKALAEARKGPPAAAAEAELLVARRALRANKNDQARELMAALDRAFPQEAAGEEGGFFAGWLDLQAGRFAEAVKAFSLYEQRYPRSRRRDEGLWFRALALLRLERYAEAREALGQLVSGAPKSNLVPQARYWIARSQELGGASAALTVPAYEAVVTTAPASFYALLASERLRALGRALPAAFPSPPRPLIVPRPPELELAVALGEAGLFADAAEEVESRVSRIRSAEQALPFAHALLQMGEYGHAHAVAARYLWGRAFGARSPDALAAFYPRAFASAVEAAATRHEVEPYLVWAIMRRESTFRPDVASAADARGLMQLIPPTGIAIAERLAEPPPNPADLFAPDLNIRYGAWYLSQLMKRFAHPVLAAAAYNAGPKAALKWAQEKGTLPLDLFIEEIPFRETRGYVKQVVADLYLYRSFYGQGAPLPPLAMTVPAPAVEGVGF
ncbi:transglycosylase SLT domain-containing protein [Stigmatella aurantiaca]|uniref:Transglycosylase n=1 Tax=Stigmatella aurantiaca (strain DW4/3-1) TaxID=378806 RepID=Q08Z75_STIAD|nr:transglycosylase SLT domain-containing protein [Stigmatella aurantiaca]ADO72280.1 Transglycosylase [Stigmatella aurantiaca DW4/3-1]EAU65769.1 soluble lytic murein transglycosylase, putative [Stigmatella aurantiaca DW4/3-1]